MTKDYVFHEIGGRIRELRGKSRQKDWASRIGCDQGYISQVENGVTKPSLSFLKGVVSITGASIDWILTGQGNRSGYPSAQDVETASSIGLKDARGIYIAKELAGNPKLLKSVDRLLKLDGTGKRLIETLADMEENRIESLAEFIGAGRL